MNSNPFWTLELWYLFTPFIKYPWLVLTIKQNKGAVDVRLKNWCHELLWPRSFSKVAGTIQFSPIPKPPTVFCTMYSKACKVWLVNLKCRCYCTVSTEVSSGNLATFLTNVWRWSYQGYQEYDSFQLEPNIFPESKTNLYMYVCIAS